MKAHAVNYGILILRRKRIIKGQIIKAVASKYTVITDDKDKYTCFIRGKVKRDFEPVVGDYVEINQIKGNNGIIEKILPRKNKLIRPYVCNIDTLIIVVAPSPQPDWILIDKLIVSCYIENVEPVLCLNKSDLIEQPQIDKYFASYIKEIKCIKTSVVDESIGLDELHEVMNGKLCCFAGQSAVGKSSIINALIGKKVMDIGELSKKIDRGKNTTRHIEIFDYGDGKIVDTCGFSLLELNELNSQELTYYYDDYVKLMSECKFKNCTHINEPDCKVKEQVNKGILSKERYDRYVNIFNELKEQQDDKY